MPVRRSPYLAAALLLAIAGAASAQPAAGIQWLERPSLRSDDYPAAALLEDLSGEATIACSADAEGHPTDCRIESESPAGYGFGEAARTVVMRGRIDPSSLSGENGADVFTVRIPFSVSIEGSSDVPDEARRQLDEGPWAVLRCRVTADRRAEDCVVLAESEPGAGIGLRAIAIFRQAVLPQSMIDSIGVGNEVTVQVPLSPISQ
jgi:TonB family protein